MSVQVDSVSKIYGKQQALDNITFQVNSGEIVGLLGPNGAGKTTLMKVITGFLSPETGTVTVNGFLAGESSLDIRRQIGYLPENNPLYSDLYIGEYLEYVAGIYRLKAVRSRVREIIGLTGLGPEQHKKIGALSKGYRQRVGIAQALIHDPSVLILDEPTSGLDPSQIVEIRQLIRNISANKTVMLSTHIMQEVEALCDRIMIINKGKIVATDSPENIISLATSVSQTILVEFAELINPELLLSIKGLISYRQKSDRIWIISAGKDDLRPIIFRFAIEQGLTILTMAKEESTLENVFLEIVK